MVVPAAYPLAAVLAGTLLGWSLPQWGGVFLGGLLVLTPALLLPVRGCGNPRGLAVCLLVCLGLAVALRTSRRLDTDLASTHLLRQAHGRPVLLEGVVCSPPVKGAGYTVLCLEVTRLRSDGNARAAQGRVELLVSGRADEVRLGDHLLAEARLRRPRRWGNPGEVDPAGASLLGGVHARGSVGDAGRLFRLGTAAGFGFRRRVENLRERLGVFLNLEPRADSRALLKAWLLGDRSEIPPATAAAFRKSGLAHLNAVSGLHVSLVGLLFYAGFRFLAGYVPGVLLRGWGNKLAAAASLPFVVLYVLVAGHPVTAVRAGVMAALVAGSLLLDRAHAVWNALALAGLVILLGDPSALFSVSCRLSFAAMVGILLAWSGWLAPSRNRPGEQKPGPGGLLRRLAGRVRSLLLISLAALLATAPLTALHFNRVTPLAMLPNLVAVPTVSWVAIPAGLGAALLSLLSTTLARPLLAVAGGATRLTASFAEGFSEFPGACLVTGTPSWPEMLLLYGAVLSLFRPAGCRWRLRVPAACLAGLLFLAAPGVIRQRWGSWLEVTYLSVGNGDGAVIELPGGRRMLVDGGFARPGSFDSGRRILAPFLGYRRICRVDLLVVSHGQADHYGGLRAVAEDFRPRELWIGPETGNEEPGYGDFLAFCAGRGIDVRRLCRQERPIVINGVTLEILHPPCPAEPDFQLLRSGGSRGVNNASLVIRLSYGGASFLWTGDLEREGERMLRAWKDAFPAGVLKVPHHGSPTSSSAALLDGVQPRVAVVSVGSENRFGFPSSALLRDCEARGTSVYRTDRDGAVGVRTDGRRVEVRAWGSGRRESWEFPETPGRPFSSRCPPAETCATP